MISDVFAFLRKRALASPNTPSTLARRAQWSTFDSVFALFADSLSNLIFCLNMSVSSSFGAGRGAFLSPSVPAPCTATRIASKPSRDCFVASLGCAKAGTSLLSLSCSSWSCFRNFSTVSVELWNFFSKKPLIRGGFVVLSLFLGNSDSYVVAFVLNLPCIDGKKAARESLPSKPIWSAAASRTARVTIGNVVPEIFTTRRGHGFDA